MHVFPDDKGFAPQSHLQSCYVALVKILKNQKLVQVVNVIELTI